MRKRVRLGKLALLAFFLVACGPAPTVNGGSTPSAANPSPTPTLQVGCSASNRCLALVKLRGSDAYVVRDITDIRNPKTVGGTPSIGGQPRFINGTEVSWADVQLYRAPLAGSPKTVAANSGTPLGIWQFDWSPDGTTPIYAAYKQDETADLHVVSGGVDRKVASMPGIPIEFGCENQECADRIALHLAYSPDGQSISWAENLKPAVRLWTAGGNNIPLGTDDADVPFMLVWSGSTLYFRDSKGIEAFSNGRLVSFLPGVNWIRPKASPAGGQIVYEARDAAGRAHTYLVDTKTAQVRDLGTDRAEPAFLTFRFIWFKS